eukprot:11541399-Prorocentrum_lima.AAC.1
MDVTFKVARCQDLPRVKEAKLGAGRGSCARRPCWVGKWGSTTPLILSRKSASVASISRHLSMADMLRVP